MCSTILSIWLWQERNKTYHKVSFSFETNQTLLLYELHFQEEYIVRGKSNFKCSTNPIPTKHSKELLKMPSSLLPITKTTRNFPTERLISNDQMDTFRERDTIRSLADLNETTASDGFQFKNSSDHTLFL